MAKRPFRSEEDLLAKLEQWLAARDVPPTLFDVVETGDRELIGGFILKTFRAAAADAVVRVLGCEAASFDLPPDEAANAPMRVFAGLAREWRLSPNEQLALLDLHSLADLEEVKRASVDHVPVGIIERLAVLLGIFKAINTLLPQAERADAWIRTPNSAPVLGGRAPLELMMEGLEGLRQVSQYLLAEVAGP